MPTKHQKMWGFLSYEKQHYLPYPYLNVTVMKKAVIS